MRPDSRTMDVIAIDEFESTAGNLVRGLTSQSKPVAITVGREAVAMLITADEWDRLTYRERVITAIKEGLADIEAGRVVSDEEVRREMDRRFGKPEKQRKTGRRRKAER